MIMIIQDEMSSRFAFARTHDRRIRRRLLGLSVGAFLMTAALQIAHADEAAAVNNDRDEQTRVSSSSGISASSRQKMRTAGGALIGIGAFSIAIGAIVTGVGLADGSFGSELTALVVGVPLMGGGVLLNGVGIPLYIVGSNESSSSALRKPPTPPVTLSANVGYGTASLKLTF